MPFFCRHSQRRYEALLRAIFETTLINLEINHVKQPQTHDLASFLEVNNISRSVHRGLKILALHSSVFSGRLFDPNSLPSTDSLLGHGNAPWIDSQDIRDKPSGDQDVATSNQDKLSREGGHVPVRLGDQAGVPDPAATPLLADRSSSWGRNGLPTLEATVERLQVAERLDDKLVKELDPLDNRADPRTDSGLSTSPNLHSPNILPVEDASSMQSSFFKEMVLEQQSGNVTNEDLPPKEVKKDQLQHFDQVTDASKKRGVSDLVGGDTNTHGFMPPTSEDAERCSGQENGPFRDGQSQTTEIAGPQKSVTKIETFGGAASTPDEQLRLEEAQSMQLSNAIHNTTEKESRSMPPPVNLSSEFIHDSMVDVDPISSVSAVNEEMSVKQDDGPEHAQRRQSELLARPTTGLRENLLPGMSGDSSRDLMLSRRPPMRIDTGVLSNSGSTLGATTRASTTTMPSASESATPSKTTSAVGNVQSPPERMTTRVSSGALRHKSVSEILGETPRATPTSADKGTFPRESGDFQREDQYSLQTPKSASALTTPDPITFRQRLTELKEKERSKLSTVVFASSRNTDVTQAQGSDNEFSIKDRDYMLTLFNFQVASPPRAHHLNALMKSAHKTLTTADHLTDFSERQACRVLNRIYELQARNCWSLRQIERSVEPARPVTHQDVLLSEMKWMRMDFKEERKWKLAAAKFTADACAVWVASNLEERRSLQIKVRSEPAKEQSQSDAAPTPDLVHSMNDDSSEVTEDESIGDLGNAPAAIFSLPPEMFVFGLNKSPIAEKLLLELPLYQPSTEVKNAALLSAKVEPDGAWRKDIVPISKYAQGKIVSVPRSASAKGISVEEGPPRKRSRFDYEQADSRSLSSRVNSDNDFEKPLEPEQEDVALFDPEHKHIRDRIHTGHAFRPPSEYIMPSQSFFEARSSSQWTQAEDDELRRIVKEYSYNWSLISSSLTLPSIFSSGAERRTPWECFERWISLEGLPVEMAKIPYFRAYHARLQAAQKTVESSQLAQQQQQGGSGAQLPSRRRTTQPYSVERRKEQRHLHLIDAMRKLAKKRETALNKQQHGMFLAFRLDTYLIHIAFNGSMSPRLTWEIVATMAAMRKAQEGPKARKEMHTPQEFSRLKYTQQLKYEEQARQYRAQMLQHQKVIPPHAVSQLCQRLTYRRPLRQPRATSRPASKPMGCRQSVILYLEDRVVAVRT